MMFARVNRQEAKCLLLIHGNEVPDSNGVFDPDQ